MFKLLNKWLRLLHRWLTPPFIPLLMTANIMHGTALGDVAQNIVAPLTVILSITGGYLWLVPYLSKWQRGRQAVASQSHSPHVAHNGSAVILSVLIMTLQADARRKKCLPLEQHALELTKS